MKKLKHSILSLLLLMGACIVSCSNDDGQTSSTDPDEVGGESFTIPVSSLRLRDPFILVDKKTSMYYLHFNNNLKIRVYKSKDLSTWKDEGYSFIAKTDFWGQQDFWAPDVYEYEGRYYLFATFSNAGVKRGTSILVSDSPKGPFTPLVNKAITPSGWMCLDGSYIDKEGNPGCCSVVSGWRPSTVKFMPTAGERSETTEGDPYLLFKASEAPCRLYYKFRGDRQCYGCAFIYRLDDGKLIMLCPVSERQMENMLSGRLSRHQVMCLVLGCRSPKR
ncbi:MAG: family 43 glycosylhydrolase [Bacteroides caccae]